MASARKKLDEKNLKVLRELVSLPENKHCFDCHQRGPTYVNVTIGSFVCTTCSGMLRGLTPPHRVKSISMATFTSEEIDLLKARGNEYCRKVWLGLYDGDQLSKDEQQIKELMIAKYEKKRYYVKPSETDKISNSSLQSSASHSTPSSQPGPKLATSLSFSFPGHVTNNNTGRNHNNNLFTPQAFTSKPKEIPKISSQDPFSSLNSSIASLPPPVIDNFANFDNNPIFSSSQLTQNAAPGAVGPAEHKVQGPPPPSEDRYAALKDLDCLMKSQQSVSLPENSIANNSDWDPGNVWTSPTNGQISQAPTSQNLFETTPQVLGTASTKDFNPFVTSNSDAAWGNAFSGNPFNADFSWPTSNGASNGLPMSQSLNFNTSKPLWNFSTTTPNPFSVSTNGESVSHHSSNPFL